MEMLSFDLRGKFAHFRKYYTNNTALSYSIPPRTTLMGITAAIMGLPRDSYYELLAPDQLRYAVQLLSPVKKSFHRLNLLMIKGGADFRGQKGRIQTPFEMVSGPDLKKDMVAYRIYVSPTEKGQDAFYILKTNLKNKGLSFNLSLGPAFCISTLEKQCLDLRFETKQGDDTFIPIASAIPVKKVGEINFNNSKLLLEEELLPGAFMGNYDRELSKMHRVLFSTDGNPISLKVKGEYVSVSEKEGITNITFFE